ncbi:MAG: formylglycine-generating enzyme family protein [Saprospiraceae bacterium]|nr:formylglycine-generating enzyme family protein [Saprospiraceae bacterium]
MVPVEGSEFDMGDEHGDLWSDCGPVHRVKVDDFYLGEYPVTQELWETVMGNSPSFFKGGQRPVEQVSWENVQIFIKKLNEITGKHFRLPSEAEWEYAARGGPHKNSYRYAGSDKLKEVGWFYNNSHGETKPVGLKTPNELGLYDMSGNVGEWCEDWYSGGDYYQECQRTGLTEDPAGPKSGSNRVGRGGSYFNDARGCRIAYRGNNTSSRRNRRIGFRLALSLRS